MTPRPDLKSCCDDDKKNGWADELEELEKRIKANDMKDEAKVTYCNIYDMIALKVEGEKGRTFEIKCLINKLLI